MIHFFVSSLHSILFTCAVAHCLCSYHEQLSRVHQSWEELERRVKAKKGENNWKLKMSLRFTVLTKFYQMFNFSKSLVWSVNLKVKSIFHLDRHLSLFTIIIYFFVAFHSFHWFCFTFNCKWKWYTFLSLNLNIFILADHLFLLIHFIENEKPFQMKQWTTRGIIAPINSIRTNKEMKNREAREEEKKKKFRTLFLLISTRKDNLIEIVTSLLKTIETLCLYNWTLSREKKYSMFII